jgi:ABC-type Fe3+/spermidine/putrescine transport system ATPase subunit
VRMSAYGDRMPHALSGGQQQRVALARALVDAPPVLLLDEPLANLDAVLREEMRDELLRIKAETDAAVVLVTHDRAEAFALADDIVLMRDGKVAQRGTPDALYTSPTTVFALQFCGASSLLPTAVAERLSTSLWRGVRDGALYVGVRPEECTLAAHGLSGCVTRSLYAGATHDIVVRTDVDGLELSCRSVARVAVGDAVHVDIRGGVYLRN